MGDVMFDDEFWGLCFVFNLKEMLSLVYIYAGGFFFVGKSWV